MGNCASKVWLILCWACVLTLAALLRIDNLEKRPFHFDEATGARITESRVNPKREYQFNPVHNHGPLLSSAAATVCRVKDESSWSQMTKHTLRLVPVISGMLLVAVPLLWRRRFGDIPVLAAAVLLATSPLLAYYSRMFIHEMMLAMLGLLAVVLFVVRFKSQALKFGAIGFVIGLMFATKETFAISIIAWSASAGIIALSNWRASKALLVDWKKLPNLCRVIRCRRNAQRRVVLHGRADESWWRVGCGENVFCLQDNCRARQAVWLLLEYDDRADQGRYLVARGLCFPACRDLGREKFFARHKTCHA